MKTLILTVSLALFSASCTTTGFDSPEAYDFRAVEMTVGAGALSESDQFDSTEAPISFGTTMLIQEASDEGSILNRPQGMVGEWGLSFSSGSGTFAEIQQEFGTASAVTINHEYAQLHAGLRYYFDVGPDWVQPYLGGAAAGRFYHLDAGGSDTANELIVGFLGRAGFDFPLGGNARLGIGYQLSAGMDPTIDDTTTNLDDHQAFLSLGWAF